MRNLLLILIAVLTFTLTSCDKKAKWNSDALILLKPAKTRAIHEGLSTEDIIDKAHVITWRAHWFSDTYWDDEKIVTRGFNDQQKDYEKLVLKMFSDDVITRDGAYRKDFTYGYDFYLEDINGDTIAYIPNSVIDNARTLIEDAFYAHDYERVYDVFNNAFTFYSFDSQD